MDLKEIRADIDSVDHDLLELFIKRMDLAGRVAEYKVANDMPVLRPEREQEILDRVEAEAGEAYGAYARDLYENILRISRQMQQKIVDTAR